MTIADTFVGEFERITVKGVEATKVSSASDSAQEVWTVTLPEGFTQANYTDYIQEGDIQFFSGGGSSTDPQPIPGPWNDPITGVTYQLTRSDPSIGYYRTEYAVTVDPEKGTLTGITVKGAAATDQGNNVWTVTLPGMYTSLTREEVAPVGYEPITTPPVSAGELFNGDPLFYYSASASGYVFELRVVRAAMNSIDDIVVAGASGVIASYKDGSLSINISDHTRFGGYISGARDTMSGQVTFTVTAVGYEPKSRTVAIEN
jgi:hypothetical protein